MAYADHEFYSQTYHGDALDDAVSAKWLDAASDELDALTFGRLICHFPTVEAHAVKVKKAVCAIAEALYYIDIQRQAAAAHKADSGGYCGAVSSVTSGKESVSYAVGTAATMYASAAANAAEQAALIAAIACKYIANIPDAHGVNLLYAGG
jgi:hypothetical protein